uniref:Uncharacterized protein n=1 Tax=Arundo donax TaxID=35708 RepID=A0A0A8YR02_ARUDO
MVRNFQNSLSFS